MSTTCKNRTTPLNPRVRKVTPKPEFRLLLEFTNGEHKIFDVQPLLSRGVFQRLQDPQIFEQAQASLGTVVWPGDLDICPDTLYEESFPVDGTT